MSLTTCQTQVEAGARPARRGPVVGQLALLSCTPAGGMAAGVGTAGDEPPHDAVMTREWF